MTKIVTGQFVLSALKVSDLGAGMKMLQKLIEE